MLLYISKRRIKNLLKYGGYSVMVSTRVCGTLSSGSNPGSHTSR